ncbi:peptidoglycan DD-metalloendopeptidase family protein [Helicobacter sp. 23-1045]
MAKILLFLFTLTFAFGATSTNKIWDKGQTFLQFLEAHNIPSSTYWNLHAEDKELTAEIYAGVRYYTLKNNEILLQALIPLNDEMQIHLYRDGGEYKVDFIPVKYFKSSAQIAISIQKSPYQDLYELTNDTNLSNEFVNIYKNSINFSKSVLKNDKLALIYDYKYRLGRSFGSPDIKAALIETNRKPNFLFAHTNGKYYDEKGNEKQGFLLGLPVPGARVSSPFSLNRKHPILKVRRPHYGIDYAAPTGTAVRAAAGGKVVYAGNKSGYGKVVEVAHDNGLKTLYAHLKTFSVKKGQKVKSGQKIAQVGSSGLSTGPHLHFGLYKNNRPINPALSIKTTKSILNKDEKKAFLANAKTLENKLKVAIMENFSGEAPSYFAKVAQ